MKRSRVDDPKVRKAQILAAAEAALEQQRKNVLTATQQVAAVQAEARNAERAAEEVAGRLGRMERELAGLEQVRAEAEQRLVRAQTGLAAAEAKVAAQKQAIGAVEGQIAAARTDREQLGAKLDAADKEGVEVAVGGCAQNSGDVAAGFGGQFVDVPRRRELLARSRIRSLREGCCR